MTAPGETIGTPVTPPRRERRWRWPVAVVAGWVVALTGISWWSVRNDPATVPEQQDLRAATPALRAATGTVLAAAQSGPWVVRLGAPRTGTCELTPVRDGASAGQDVFLYVPEGQARTALDAVAAALPGGYRAAVVPTRAGTRLSLFADAGDFIAIEARAQAADQVLTLTVDTGCRPGTPGDAGAAGTAPGEPAPATLTETVAALGGPAGGGVSVQAVRCPAGGTAATYRATAGPAADGPRGVPGGVTPVWAGAGGWAYRKGPESVVVDASGERLQVSVTTGCRA
ncbi:hypothetical protein BJY16_001148 [Actinoplanes octamycinicus]|uniref:Uncharacterized protein n=1 Tax=Actinoplanes octamycinicus TaxID=135948 RepID=A0A7W7M5G0_9ACTN|nr:hypothetical protein [Actinoplanes octamycinicus]MBB4737689.1 hypothetical protein [Actinoplanes octamycinicus]